jgi:hypothetical protein
VVAPHNDGGTRPESVGLRHQILEDRPRNVLPVWACHWKVRNTALRAAVCVVDATDEILGEAKVISQPEAIVSYMVGTGSGPARIALDAGAAFGKAKLAGQVSTAIRAISLAAPSGLSCRARQP